jgi:hypothetical protein
MGDEGGMAFLDAVTYINAAVAASAGTNAAAAKAGAAAPSANGAASPMLGTTLNNTTAAAATAAGTGAAAAVMSVLSVGFSLVEINIRECGVDPRIVQLIAEKLARGAELAELIKAKNDFPPNTAATNVASSSVGFGGDKAASGGKNTSGAISGTSPSKPGTASRTSTSAAGGAPANGILAGVPSTSSSPARGGNAATSAGGGAGMGKLGSVSALGDEHLVDLALRVARDRTDAVAALTLESIW